MIYYFEKSKLLRLALEKGCQSRNLSIFTLDSIESCQFYFSDMPPSLLIIDSETFKLAPESLIASLIENKPTEIPVVWVGAAPEDGSSTALAGELWTKPYSVMALLDYLDKIAQSSLEG